MKAKENLSHLHVCDIAADRTGSAHWTRRSSWIGLGMVSVSSHVGQDLTTKELSAVMTSVALGSMTSFYCEDKDWLNIVDVSHHHEFYEIIEASPRTLVGGFSVSAKYVIPDGAITRP